MLNGYYVKDDQDEDEVTARIPSYYLAKPTLWQRVAARCAIAWARIWGLA